MIDELEGVFNVKLMEICHLTCIETFYATVIICIGAFVRHIIGIKEIKSSLYVLLQSVTNILIAQKCADAMYNSFQIE